jgi:hypothetical protein
MFNVPPYFCDKNEALILGNTGGFSMRPFPEAVNSGPRYLKSCASIIDEPSSRTLAVYSDEADSHMPPTSEKTNTI